MDLENYGRFGKMISILLLGDQIQEMLFMKLS